jgi:hypothetical protein
MKLATLFAASAALVTLLVLFLTAQRIPTWYVPVRVADDPAEQQRVRDSLTEAVDRFRAGLAAGQPFEFRISDRTINEWVVARAGIYPESTDWLPAWLSEPVLRFTEEGIVMGARYDRDGWKAIVSLHLQPKPRDDRPGVRIGGVEIGALPVPFSMVRERLIQSGALSRIRAERLPGSIQRALLPEVPAGADSVERWLPVADLVRDDSFRVTAVATLPGELVLNIEPLERRRK